ncbi:hypothetical protein [Moorena sp. SIO4A5]|uniref:DUF433 domain-containing protein n=1 Tax=Moorena sp. SIO4A5 TaxID=2607838 RepID=UPI0013CDDD70|nr:hypothetical protein [Moorena sp. SIO4A5]NEO19579.1 DUF433 domain-containing protein [Moorena sp. SIO4A5]
MSDTKVFFGVSLELAGKTISLEPKNAINEIKEKGIEVELPAGESPLDEFLEHFPSVSREHAIAALELAKEMLTAYANPA